MISRLKLWKRNMTYLEKEGFAITVTSGEHRVDGGRDTPSLGDFTRLRGG